MSKSLKRHSSFTGFFSGARAAVATSVIDACIFLRVFMPTRTVCRGSLPCAGVTALSIDFRGRDFQVRWVHATAHAAEMVNDLPPRDFTDQKFVSESVSNAVIENAVPIFADSGGPEPTVLGFPNLRPKLYFQARASQAIRATLEWITIQIPALIMAIAESATNGVRLTVNTLFHSVDTLAQSQTAYKICLKA